MVEKLDYVPKSQRKKILLLCDDIRMHSGIGGMGREIVIGTSHHYNWVNIGAGINHPDVGKVLDLSEDVNKHAGINDSYVKIVPNNGYGSPDLLRQIMNLEKPDALFIFTDPRYWIWLFEIEREVRTRIPIFYLNIWDNFPAPMYNRPYYESVDLLMAISKQTKLINELVLGEEKNNKVLTYVPHGVNENHFYPIAKDHPEHKQLVNFKKRVLPDEKADFVVFYNSRNIRRKCTSALILAYKLFCDKIGKENAKKCSLIMHTELIHEAGTDLGAVCDSLCDPSYINISFSTGKLSVSEMNMLYNISDVTTLISANEGWGLSLTESMMAGKMIIANVTGGMQDQLRFEDDNKTWYEPTADIPSNHRKTYTKCGEWAVPVFPSSRILIGSPLTPYIFEDHANPEDVADALLTVYNLSKSERKARGLKGREWVLSEESGMSSTNMAKNIIKSIELGFNNFKPRKPYELIKVKEVSSKLVPHKLTDY